MNTTVVASKTILSNCELLPEPGQVAETEEPCSTPRVEFLVSKASDGEGKGAL